MAYATVGDGHITSIVVLNSGSGYIAPPQIDIVGDGAGATAEAVMSSVYPVGHPHAGLGYGSVVGINITNPGNGYWVIPTSGLNMPPGPVSPTQQGAIILIGTGFVDNLYYR
jgi:hypothetical protein